MDTEKNNQRTNPWNNILSKKAFETWDKNGRITKGVEDELYIYNKKLFKNNGGEACITFDIHDGFAVGCYQGREYLLLYPRVDIVEKNKNLSKKIERYPGENIYPHMVAMALGKIEPGKYLPLNLQDGDKVFRLDTPIETDRTMKLIREQTNNWYISEPDDLPVIEYDKVGTGYLIVRNYGGTEYRSLPDNKEDIKKMEEEMMGKGAFFSLKHLVQRNKQENFLSKKGNYSFDDFQKLLNERYPEGITVNLKDVSLFGVKHIITETEEINPKHDAWQFANNLSWKGQVASGEEKDVIVNIKVSPDKYKYIWPEMNNVWEYREKALDIAANEQLHTAKGNIENVNMQIPQCVDFLHTMEVEGVPLRDALFILEKYMPYNSKDIASVLALHKWMTNGREVWVPTTNLNSQVYDRMNQLWNRGKKENWDNQKLDNMTKILAKTILKEKKLIKSKPYNLVFTVKGTGEGDSYITSTQNAIAWVDYINRTYSPTASAIQNRDLIKISINTEDSLIQSKIENNIIENPCFAKTWMEKPFEDYSIKNRAFVLLENGCVIDGYANRPGNGKTGATYTVDFDKAEKKSILRPITIEELENNTYRIDSDNIIEGEHRIFDVFYMKKEWERIKDIHVYSNRKESGYRINCKVDGLQTLFRPLPETYSKILDNLREQGEEKLMEYRDNLKLYFAGNVFKDLLKNRELEESVGRKM